MKIPRSKPLSFKSFYQRQVLKVGYSSHFYLIPRTLVTDLILSKAMKFSFWAWLVSSES